jgi:hypothetical protein
MEFRIWTMLIEQSRGALHVFLPLLDRGLDGVIHRLTDGEYAPVQVKSRGSTSDGMVEIVIRGDSLVDDRALIIAGLHTAEDLGPTLLVVDEATFKRMAAHDYSEGKDFYSAAFSMRANKGNGDGVEDDADTRIGPHFNRTPTSLGRMMEAMAKVSSSAGTLTRTAMFSPGKVSARRSKSA